MHVPADPREAGNSTLKTFLDLLHQDTPSAAHLDDLLGELRRTGLVEKALRELKRLRPRSNSSKDPVWRAVRERLEALSEQARTRRQQDWQLDPGRRTLRVQFELRPPACTLNPSGLVHALADLAMAADFPLAFGLERHPRPMVTLGPPLPLGVESLQEWADLVLTEPLKGLLEDGVARLNAHAPAGLRIASSAILPSHASPLLDLAREARWRWQVPEDLLDAARDRVARFEASEHFEIEKTGKQDGAKTVKRREVRALVTALRWEGAALCFSTTLSAGEALSPLKLLAGILQVEPARITGLTRLEVRLGEDARLAQGDRFEPKLHNMWEDAVLLESCDGLSVMDDEGDDLLLGR